MILVKIASARGNLEPCPGTTEAISRGVPVAT